MDVRSRPELGDEDYDYPEDFTDETDDQDIPLPGLHALPGAGHWPRGGDWRLPGLIDDTADGADSSANAYPGLSASPSASELVSETTVSYRINASAAAHTPAPEPSQRDPPWSLRYGPFGTLYEAVPATLRTHAAPQLRPSPHTPLRTTLFSPLSGGGGASSSRSSILQHRESPQAGPRHPLSLSNQHHYLTLPQRQSYPASPTVSHPWRQQQPEPQPPRQHIRQSDRAADGRGGPGATVPSPAGPADSAGRGPASAAGDGSGFGSTSRWSFRGASDRYRRSSCSSSVSSRDESPPDRQSTSQYSSLGPARSTPHQPWYGSRFANALFETGDALDESEELFGSAMGEPGLARRTNGAAGTGRGVLGREPEGRSGGLSGLGLGLAGLNGERRHSPTPSVSSRSSSGSSSSSSWTVAAAEREDRAPAGVSVLPQLPWPMGAGGDEYVARSRRADSPSVGGASDWGLPPPGELRQQQHVVRGGQHGGGVGGGWRPLREEDGQDILAGPSSSHLPRVGEPSWERNRYGAGVGAAGSISLPHGTIAPRSPIAGRFYSSAALGGSSLLGTSSLGSGSFTGMSPVGSNGPGHTLSAGMGVLSGGPGDLSLRINPSRSGGGGAHCYNAMDSSVGPYERRRAVLTSAHRRMSALDSPGPSARQYSDGLAGMLTNAQIQEWMSQHASRLLLPRHMHEIADIVFRPPSAVPEKKPPKCKPGSSLSASLPPHVVLGGRGPSPHVTRITSETAFMMSLLSGLPGVDPGNSRVQAVVTALQGKDINVGEAAVEAWPPQRPGSAQRPRSGARTMQQSPMLSAP